VVVEALSPKEILVYIDGEYYPKSEAKISVYDHGLLYGDGVFEGIRVYDGRVFMFDRHIERLYESAKGIDLQIPVGREKMKTLVLETLRKNNLRNAYVRLVVTRGVGNLGLDPRSCPMPTIIIITDELKPILGDKPANTITSSIRRNPTFCVNPMIKSLNYLNNVLARMEGNRAGVTEVIMLDVRGFVSEGSGDNIFIVKKGKLITPPPTASILVGITRNVVMELAEKEKIEVLERDITLHEIYTADEVFLTGTGAEVVPVAEVDGRKIRGGEPGPITLMLKTKFSELTNSEGTPVY